MKKTLKNVGIVIAILVAYIIIDFAINAHKPEYKKWRNYKFGYYFIFVSFLFFYSCINNNKKNDTYISNLANENFSGYLVLQLTNNDCRVVKSSALNNVIYSLHYKDKYPSYKLFINSLINNDIQDITKFIKPQKTVDDNFIFTYNEYENKGLSYIINKYLTKDKFGNLQFRSEPNIAVIKIMFDNLYYIYFNDYRGEYTFKKKYL